MSKHEGLDTTFRRYAWDYFSVHAAQRLTAFQFFITLATALVGGYLVLITNNGNQKWTSVLGFLLAILSFVFYKLDSRTKELIKNAERALKYLDDLHELPDIDSKPHKLRLFSFDEDACAKKTGNIVTKRYSYSDCFKIVFIGFGCLGLLAAMHALIYFPSEAVERQNVGDITIKYWNTQDSSDVTSQ